MVEIRTITADEMPAFLRAVVAGFGGDPGANAEEAAGRLAQLADLDATWVAVDRGRIVATFGFLPFDLTLPGGVELAMAGTTQVTVAATHRRRGILTELMRRHLLQSADERGLALAGLWASDERIYRRFGFGPASFAQSLTVPTEAVQVPPGPSGLSYRTLEVDEARTVLPALYDRCRSGRPGTLSRSPLWWDERHLDDPEHRRGGGSARRIVLAERDGEPVGYVTYRLAGGRFTEENRREGRVEVEELMPTDDQVRRGLWSFLAGIDLHPDLRYELTPVDDPLPIEVARFRHLTHIPLDALWLRPLDLPRLLAARTYPVDGCLVLEVEDGFLGRGGRFRLEVADGAGRCEATDAPPDLTLDVSDLGSLYLGGRAATPLARAGRIVGRPDAVATADALFASPVVPWCPEVF